MSRTWRVTSTYCTSPQFASSPPQATESPMLDVSNAPAYDGPQVRLTMPAYEAMMKEMHNGAAQMS